MTNRRILTVSELADHLNVHRITIYRLLKSGNLPGFKIGRVWRFDLDEIGHWMDTGKSPQYSANLLAATTDGHLDGKRDGKLAAKVGGKLDGKSDGKPHTDGARSQAGRAHNRIQPTAEQRGLRKR